MMYSPKEFYRVEKKESNRHVKGLNFNRGLLKINFGKRQEEMQKNNHIYYGSLAATRGQVKAQKNKKRLIDKFDKKLIKNVSPLRIGEGMKESKS